MKLRYILIPVSLVVLWIFLDVYTTKRLENEIERLRAAGEMQTFEEYAAGAREPAEGEGRVTRFLYELQPDKVVQPEAGNVACQVDERSMLRVDGEKVWNNWSPQMEADCRAVVEANRALLDEVHALMALEPDPPEVVRHFAVRDANTFIETKIPSLPELRSLANLLTLQALAAARQDKSLEFGRSVRDQLRLADRLQSIGDSLIMLMVADAIVSMAVTNISYGVEKSMLCEIDAVQLHDELGLWQGYERFVQALKGERQVFLQGTLEKLETPEGRSYQRPIRFWVANDLYVCLSMYKEAISLAGLAYVEYKPRYQEWGKRRDNLNWLTPISSILVPNLLRSRGQTDTTIERVAKARVEIALNRYRAVHGAYPEALEALVPEYLDGLPVVPQTGEAPGYSLSGGGYELVVSGEGE